MEHAISRTFVAFAMVPATSMFVGVSSCQMVTVIVMAISLMHWAFAVEPAQVT